MIPQFIEINTICPKDAESLTFDEMMESGDYEVVTRLLNTSDISQVFSHDNKDYSCLDLVGSRLISLMNYKEIRKLLLEPKESKEHE